jgi:hypothetical protein
MRPYTRKAQPEVRSAVLAAEIYAPVQSSAIVTTSKRVAIVYRAGRLITLVRVVESDRVT